MTKNERCELLWNVAIRLQAQAIRCEHDCAEAYIHSRWFDWQKYGQAARELRLEASACFAAAR